MYQTVEDLKTIESINTNAKSVKFFLKNEIEKQTKNIFCLLFLCIFVDT